MIRKSGFLSAERQATARVPQRGARGTAPSATDRATAQASPWGHELDRAVGNRARGENSEDLQTDDITLFAQSTPTPGAPAPAPAPAPAAPAPSATLGLTGNKYTDNATESRKNIKYNVTWTGGAKEDYVLVQFLKGSIKQASGTPFKVQMYGSIVDFDFADWQVDSLDSDPVYASSGGTRWNYSVDAPDKFSSTDSPGPMKNSFGKGAEAKVDFKIAVYKSADVQKSTTGSISATPITSFEPWDFNVSVLGGGKYSH